jgi:hypothetical protein
MLYPVYSDLTGDAAGIVILATSPARQTGEQHFSKTPAPTTAVCENGTGAK